MLKYINKKTNEVLYSAIKLESERAEDFTFIGICKDAPEKKMKKKNGMIKTNKVTKR